MSKIVRNLRAAICDSGLTDGMTISFHHHLRNGDSVLNTVLAEIEQMGIRNLTINASAILDVHQPLIRQMQSGVVTGLEAAYVGPVVGRAVTNGILDQPMVFRTHGGRTSDLAQKKTRVHVAFIAASAADCEGNCTGRIGKSAFGGMGYAVADAEYADYKIAITDSLQSEPLQAVAIRGDQIDRVVVVDTIGDPNGIVSSTTQITQSPVRLKIAADTASVLAAAGMVEDGLKFQTGAGGISLAVAQYLKNLMAERHITGDYCLGGITSYMVEMLHGGYFKRLLDAQCFDQAAITSLNQDRDHVEISCEAYASPARQDSYVNSLDVAILGATEIGLDFNVNVHTDSFGYIMGGSGGHSDAAAGAQLTVIVAPLLRGRIPLIREHVSAVSTPGRDIDVLVTEYGVAVNPVRQDLRRKLSAAGVNLVDIDQQYQKAIHLSGRAAPLNYGEKAVANVLCRDGTVMDTIYTIN